MNLQRPNANEATRTANRSRNVSPMSGICTRCIDGCTGNCEVFKATFRGRELIYPGPSAKLPPAAIKTTRSITRTSISRGMPWEPEGCPRGSKATRIRPLSHR